MATVSPNFVPYPVREAESNRTTGQNPETDALALQGVPWEAQRVKNQYFSVSAISKISSVSPESIEGENAIGMATDSNLRRGLLQAEFVCLVVTCIYQR